MKQILLISIFISLISACEPLTDTFSEPEIDCQYYKSDGIKIIPDYDSTLLVMTWNIRFGAGRILWFGDACGERSIMNEQEVRENLLAICEYINLIKPHILFLQEADIQSKRTAYIDQVQFILDNTYFKYAVYASGWKSQFIPSDGLGRINSGNAILSCWEIDEATRHSLPLRNDADALTKYFYLRDNFITARLKINNSANIYLSNVHLVSTTGDDTKKRQLDKFLEIMQNYISSGKSIIAGGDFNLIPPNSDTTDFCLIDECPGENFHDSSSHPYHKDGSSYTEGITWMQALYNLLEPSLSLSEYQAKPNQYHTHSLKENVFWCRMIDYLFTSKHWKQGTHQVHQSTMKLSDHAPVTAEWRLK